MASALSTTGLRLITTGGLGFCRPASGTWGSMPPVALAGLMLAIGLNPARGVGPCLAYHAILILVLLFFTLVCVVYGDAAEARYGVDPGEVVADETAGQCLPLLFLPAAATAHLWPALFTLIGAFLAFRLFDILKPWPAAGLQKHPGGWGIVLDDLAAGVQAMILVQVVTHLML